MNSWQKKALQHAKDVLPNESCGLVVEIDNKEEYFPCNNVAVEGVNSFTIDPEDWVKAEDSGTVLHICHSHPNGDLTASEEDIQSCNYIGLSWFIFDPLNDEVQELKPEVLKPLLHKNKFVDRERREDEQGLRKIKVYGRLAELLGWHVNYADVKNIKDVYKYFKSNNPNIEKYLNTEYNIIKFNNNPIQSIEEMTMDSEGDITIIPVVSGAFWWFVAPLLIGGGAAVAAIGTSVAIAIGSALISVGVGMAVQGVTNMLFPQQQPDIGDIQGIGETDTRMNYSFSGIQNVSRSGVCIPLIYGEVFTGSIVVSSGTDTAPVFKD
tara:strand:+ start:401 stop:1369 length:969 start_codon:yes stop_codon:yes gene_type:complete